MRRLVVPLGLLAAFSLVGAAHAATGPSSTLQLSADRVLYGNQVTLSGRVSNRLSGQKLAVIVRPYGEGRSARPVTTRSGGFWSYRSTPAKTTTYQVRSTSNLSRALTVGVQPRVSIDELGDGRIWVKVDGARTFRGQEVALQHRLPDGTWETVLKQALGPDSTATLMTTLRSATVRISMSVNQAGLGYLGTASHAMRYHDYQLTLTPSAYKVVYGSTVMIRGKLQNGHAGETVTINAWPYGASAPTRAAVVRTTKNGAWVYAARPLIATAYQALWAGTELSPRRMIGVAPRVSISALSNGHVVVSVSAGHSMKGRDVQLQRKSGGDWTTVQKLPLLGGSKVIFRGPLPASTLRAAISVNQAGVGYLGAISHSLAYRAQQ